VITKAVVVHSSIDASWSLFPEFMGRVKSFCSTYDSDINLPILEEFLKMSFVSKKPSALMILGLDEQGTPLAHMLAIAEAWFGYPVVTVVQLEADKRIPQELWYEAEAAIDTFAQAHNANIVQIAARNQSVARLFRMKGGFKENRIIMRRPVNGRAVSDPSKVG